MSDKLEKAGYKHVMSKANPFVRYADNFIVMTKTKEELPVTLTFVKEVIEGELGLKLSEDKTKLTNPRFHEDRLQKRSLVSFFCVICGICGSKLVYRSEASPRLI